MKTYCLNPTAKRVNRIGAVFLLVVATVSAVVIYLDPSIKTVPPMMIYAALLLVVTPLFVGIGTFRRMSKPEIELQEDGLKLYRGNRGPYLLKEISLRWSDIAAIVVQTDAQKNFGPMLWLSKSKILLTETRVIKFMLNRANGPSQLFFSLAGVENSEELIADLKSKIPDIKHNALKRYISFSWVASLKEELKFGKFILSQRGISKTGSFGSDTIFIPWIRICSLVAQSTGASLAGYWPVEVNYISELGDNGQVVIGPRISNKYLTFIKYLINHSTEASIDPALLNMLEYQPREVYFDFLSLLMAITAFFFQFVVMYLMSDYVLLKHLAIFALMVLTFTIPPVYLIIKYLGERESRNVRHTAVKKITVAIVSILMPIAASLVFILASPFTRYHLSAAMAMHQHDLVAAETYYKKAVEIDPEDFNVNLDLAILYRKKQQYAEALLYLENIFNQRICWGGPEVAVLLPDTLYTLKRYDEALAWCEKMTSCDNQQQGVRTEPIKRKRLEIVSRRKLSRE